MAEGTGTGKQLTGKWQLVHPYDAYEKTNIGANHSQTPTAGMYNDDGFFTQYSNTGNYASGECPLKGIDNQMIQD